MAANLTLAAAEDADRLLAMLSACHEERGVGLAPERREAALRPLLEGGPLGAAYLIGPRKAPVGFIAVTFGWSLEIGGMTADIGEFWIRPGVRGRGMGTEVLTALLPTLEQAGVRAIRFFSDGDGDRRNALFARLRFVALDDSRVMMRTARRG
jgi:ribosomal protein S18 acetylase RimI-like enzyme